MTRWKASAIHFALSFIVLAGIFAVMIWRWYPPALIGMTKAGTLLFILGSVNLIAGPLLTLIVYRHGKKGMKFDLIFIAIVQVAALAFGLHTAWNSRPAYIVATTDRFHLVFANEISPASAAAAAPPYRHAPWFGPRQVAAPLPDDPDARLEAMIEAMTDLPIQLQPSKYRPYPGPNRDPMSYAIPMQDAIRLAPAPDRPTLQRMVERHRGMEDLALLPLKSSRGSAGVLVERHDGAIVEFVAIDPWPIFNAAAMARRKDATP